MRCRTGVSLVGSSGPKDWVFPSERGTPLRKDNVWWRCMRPKLAAVGLAWANFQVALAADARDAHAAIEGGPASGGQPTRA